MNEATTTTIAQKAVTLGVIGANGGAVIGGNEVLTAIGLEALVFAGLTYGAWVKLFLLFSLLVIVAINLKKLWVEVLSPLFLMLASYKNKNKTSVEAGNIREP